MRQDRLWDESGARGIDVPVAAAGLLVGKEALRQDQVQMISGASHRHIQKPAFFLDLRRACRSPDRTECSRQRR